MSEKRGKPSQDRCFFISEQDALVLTNVKEIKIARKVFFSYENGIDNNKLDAFVLRFK